MEHYSPQKKNEPLSYITGMDLTDKMSKRNQTQENEIANNFNCKTMKQLGNNILSLTLGDGYTGAVKLCKTSFTDLPFCIIYHDIFAQ